MFVTFRILLHLTLEVPTRTHRRSNSGKDQTSTIHPRILIATALPIVNTTQDENTGTRDGVDHKMVQWASPEPAKVRVHNA